MDVKVEVKGIRELSSAFKQIDTELPKELRVAFKEIAATVASTAAGQVPRRSGAAAGSIRPRATPKGAGIAFGGSSAPYMPWLEFGGAVGRNRSVTRPFMKTGRYIFPAIADAQDEIGNAALAAVETVAEHAGFGTKG